MTKEEKQLLLKDLYTRLPYSTRVLTEDDDKGHIIGVDDIENGVFEIHIIEDGDSYTCYESIENFKPYLRSMSSVSKMWGGLTKEEIENPWILFDSPVDALDYFLINHIDFRGLIPIGLALEAPEDMYK